MHVSVALLPSQSLQELVVSKSSEGEVWQDGHQVSQQAAVGRHQAWGQHRGRAGGRGIALTGAWGEGRVAGVCVTLAWEMQQEATS